MDIFKILMFIIVVFVLVIYYITRTKVVYYYTQPSLVDYNFPKQVHDILTNTNWFGKYRPVEVNNQSIADIIIKLSSRKELDQWHDKKQFYPSGKQIRFSITTQNSMRKPRIYIDEVNWQNGVPESGLSLSEYRKYVIRHEFMHGLGYDHQPCNAVTSKLGVCPVLYQSTRGCPKGFKCGSNVTETDFSIRMEDAYL